MSKPTEAQLQRARELLRQIACSDAEIEAIPEIQRLRERQTSAIAQALADERRRALEDAAKVPLQYATNYDSLPQRQIAAAACRMLAQDIRSLAEDGLEEGNDTDGK